MSSPIVATTKITPSSGELKGLVWVFEVNAPVVFKYAVESTGNSKPYCHQKIDWGDGNIVQSPRVPIGRKFQSQHAYSEVGEYTIRLGAINLDREECDYNTFNSIRVRVVPLGKEKQDFSRWRGLALPYKSIADNLAAVEDVYLSSVHALASNALSGETSIVIAGEGLEFERGASVQITQEDRFVTSAKVLSTELNVVYLDFPLSSNYEASEAQVQLERYNLGRKFHKELSAPSWYFPVSKDGNLVKAEIAAILSTRIGERVMLRSFGSRLHELVFDPNDGYTKQLATQYVVGAIQQWAPRATISKSSIIQKDDEMRIILEVNHNLETFQIDFGVNEVLMLK